MQHPTLAKLLAIETNSEVAPDLRRLASQARQHLQAALTSKNAANVQQRTREAHELLTAWEGHY